MVDRRRPTQKYLIGGHGNGISVLTADEKKTLSEIHTFE
jgi:hypothetical protein